MENVGSEWILDPEFPENYHPVSGEEELYTVIDNNGNIIQYRQRSQQADGLWLWQDVDPHIPESYEAVEGINDI